jgi:hypothetical protein
MRVPARRQSSLLSHSNWACIASAMRQPWTKPNWVSTVPSSGETEALDEVLAQEPHRHGVEEERTLSTEADDTALRVELQQLLVAQIVVAHIVDTHRPRSFKLK